MEESFHLKDWTDPILTSSSHINTNPWTFDHVHAYVHDDLYAGTNDPEFNDGRGGVRC